MILRCFILSVICPPQKEYCANNAYAIDFFHLVLTYIVDTL